MVLFKKKQKSKVNPGLTLIMGKAGSGKSTMMGLIVRNAIKRGIPVYCSHHVLGAIQFNPKEDLGKKDIQKAIVIVDEAQMEYDARDFKTFPQHNKFFFSHYRHFELEVYILSQSFEDLDVKIRRQSKRMYLMKYTTFFNWFIVYEKIRMQFGISEDQTSIITKYVSGLFDLRIKFGRPAWKYFDSYSKPELDPMEIESWGLPPTPRNLLSVFSRFIDSELFQFFAEKQKK